MMDLDSRIRGGFAMAGAVLVSKKIWSCATIRGFVNAGAALFSRTKNHLLTSIPSIIRKIAHAGGPVLQNKGHSRGFAITSAVLFS